MLLCLRMWLSSLPAAFGCFAKISGNILVVILYAILLVPLPAAGHVGQVVPPTVTAAALLVTNHTLVTATVLSRANFI